MPFSSLTQSLRQRLSDLSRRMAPVRVRVSSLIQSVRPRLNNLVGRMAPVRAQAESLIQRLRPQLNNVVGRMAVVRAQAESLIQRLRPQLSDLVRRMARTSAGWNERMMWRQRLSDLIRRMAPVRAHASSLIQSLRPWLSNVVGRMASAGRRPSIPAQALPKVSNVAGRMAPVRTLAGSLTQRVRHRLRDGRNRSIATYFVTSLSGRGVGILCQLVQVPLALRYLGKEAFGVWVTLASLAYLVSFSDFGIGTGAQNQITEALGAGEGARARKLCLTTLAFLCLVAVLLMAIGVPTFLSLHWAKVFKLSDTRLIRAMPIAMSAFLVLTCLNLPLGIGRRLAFATQQAWLDNMASTLGGILTLVGVYLGARLRVGFEGYIIITSLPPTLVSIGLLASQWITLKWMHGRGVWFDRVVLRGLLNLGLLFGVQQVCTLVLFAGPPLLISTLVGAAAITPFNLVQRIFNVFQMFQNAFLLPLWPAYADAKAKGDWEWMGRTLRRSLWATVGVAVVPMIGIAFVTRPLIRLWTGTAASVPTGGLVVALLLWNIVVATQQPLGFFLAGVSEVKRNTVYSLLTAASAGALMFLLAPHFGINGIVMGLVIGNTAFSLTGCAYEVWRYFQRLAGVPLAVPAVATVPHG